MQAAVKADGASPPGAALYGMYMLSLGACLVGNLLMRLGTEAGLLAPWSRVTLGVVSALPLVASAVLFWRLLRRELDEMMQRIVLEGMAFALVVYVPLAGLFVNLRTSGVWTPRLDPPEILMGPAVLVAVGIAIAWRRYQ
jgi:hypothetical protein